MMSWQDDTILSSATSAPSAAPTLPPQKNNLWDNDPILASSEQLPEVGPSAASGPIESIQAGVQASVGGLFWRGRLPELVLDPEHAKWWERALSGISQVGMDIPVMALGGAFGGAAGGAAGTAVAPGPGTAVGGILGAGAGMFGTPAMMREILISGYRSGEIKTAAEFWNALRGMAGDVALATTKEAAIGAATFGAGSVAARTVGKAILPAIGEKITATTAIKTIGAADTAAQIATMVAMPAALQGRIPDAQEFMDAAIVIGGLKLAVPLSERMMRTFAKTGKTPAEQVADAKKRPEMVKEQIIDQIFEEVSDAIAKDRIARGQFTKQEELWSIQGRLAELERKANGTPETTAPGPEGKPITVPAAPPAPLTGAERVERDTLRTQAAAIEAEGIKPEVPRETEPSGFSPEQLAEARDRAAARITELTTKEGAAPLTDVERVERIGLVNALSRPEELARRFEIVPERRIPTADERAASSQRVFDDVLSQLREVDAARRAGGLEPLGDEHAQAVAVLVRARVQARAERLGRLPEDVYAERPLKIRDQLQGGEELPGEPVPPEAPRFPSPEVDIFGNKLEPETLPRLAVETLATVETPLAGLTLSKEVPQFKKDANIEGVIVPLGGTFDRTGVGPIQVWERMDGRMEVISGRHRLDLARRSGETTIPAQIHREVEGFDAKQAATLDAQLNIREEQGSVADYTQYFRDSGISKDAADQRGLLARAKGRAGWTISRDGGVELIASHRAGLLSDDAALAISQTAPGSERLQVLGITMVNDGKSILYATNMMRSLDLMASERAAGGQQIDIFGFDDSAMIEAAAMAKKASSAQRHIAEQISSVSGAAKRPELARKMGVNVEDPEGIKKRIAELRQEQYQWDNWPLYPDLVARLRGEGGEAAKEPQPAYAVDHEARQDVGGFEPGKVEASPEQFDLFTQTKIPESPISGLEKIIVESAQVGKHTVAFNRIREAGEAASVFQHLNDSPMEKFQVLGLDAKDKPIAYFSLFSGTLSQTSVYPREVWTAIYQTPGIKSVWIAHQHPSGIPEPSASDRMLTGELRKALTPDIGVTLRGHLIVTRNGTVDIGSDGQNREMVEVKKGTAKKTIPIMERKVIKAEEEREAINSPSSVREFFRKMAPNETGLLVLDTQHGVIGWWPMTEAEMSKLRTGDINTGMAALMRKVGRGNIAAAIAYSPGKTTPEFERGVGNIGTALSGADVRMLDAFTVEDGGRLVSFAETGKRTTSMSGTFFQTAERPEFDLRAETPAEAMARDKEAADAAKRKITQDALETKGKKFTVDQLDVFNTQPTLFQSKEGSGGQTDTPEFKRWFGESKVVVNGAPQRLIHSTNADWNIFDPKQTLSSFGFHAGTAQQAEAVRETGGTKADLTKLRPLDGMNMMPVYLKIENPLRMADNGTWYPFEMVEHLAKAGIADNRTLPANAREAAGFGAPHMDITWANKTDARKKYDLIVKERMENWSEQNPEAGRDQYEQQRRITGRDYVRDLIEKTGHDGIVYNNKYEGGGDSWIAFRPEQIKSAIGNSGAFDPNNPDIRFQGKGQERNGEHLGSYTVAENLITTFKNANKSTIVHELGHSWLEEMRIDVLRQDVPAQIKADWEIIRREFAIGEKVEISTASHEHFAKTFERYLAEGRAPSVGLRGVFERFKAWMLDVYKNLTNIGTEINPEVRGVFDRMLATDQEIADARELGVPRSYVDLARRTEAEKIVPPPEFRKIEPGAEAEQARKTPFADELPPGPGEAPDNIHVNYKYINSPMDVKLAMQRMAEIDQRNIQRQRGGAEGVKSWEAANAEQAKYLNDILGGSEDTLRILSPRDPNAAGPDVKLGVLKKLAVGAAQDSAKLRDVVLEAGHDATVRQQLEYMGSIERARMIQAEFLGERAGVARALNALKDVTEGTGEIGRMLDVIGYGERAARELYQTARTAAEEQAYQKAQLDAIMLNYRGKTALDIAKLHKEIGSLKGSYGFSKKVLEATTWEKLVEGWKSFLLSGPVTHTTNLFGTEAFHWLQPAVDVLAATIGMARGASPGFGETDRASMSEAIGRMSGMLAGVQDGLKVGMAAMRTGEGTGKTESYREAIPGRLGHIIRTPLRMMGAEDAMVTTMYERGELKTLAIRQAFNENLNPKTRAFADRVQYLTDHPTPEIEARALATATRMTFNTPYGEKGLALANFINKWNLQWMIPFTRTPINIALEMLRLSPFAPGVEAWRADFAKGGAARDRALAEVTLGVGISALTMAYAFSGNITGAGSPDPGKNRTKEGVWQPYSVFIGGKWYEYSRIQPVGTLMGMAADMANVWDHMTDEEKDKLPKMISVAFANAITNQTFLQGITNFINAISDPNRFAPRFTEQFAGSMVPNIIGQPTAMMDPHIREINGMFDAIQARIPGWREGLLPSRDWLGEPRASKERVGVIMPVRTLDPSKDKVRLEAARLNLSMAAPPRKTHLGKGTGKIGDVPLTPEERDVFAKVGGEMTHNILTNIVNAPGYDEIPDMIKRKIFAKVVAASHQAAAVAALPPEKRADYLQQITEKMQTELTPGEP